MKKILLLVLLAVNCNVATAGWSKVSVIDGTTTYIDLTSLVKAGVKVKVWDIMDIKRRNINDKYLSLKSQHEFDCKENKSRVLSYSTYSGSMAIGNVVTTSNRPHDWLPVKSGGITEELMKLACAKH